ncbi:MAG: hypothetical protein QXU99_00935 [Candidatus Bathyarchaeia archaeon]
MVKEEEEIIVSAPSKSVVSTDKKTAKAIDRALEEEKFAIFEILKRVSGYFGVLIFFSGVILLGLFIFVSVSGQEGLLVFSSASPVFILVLWIFLGVINVVGGCLLICSE